MNSNFLYMYVCILLYIPLSLRFEIKNYIFHAFCRLLHISTHITLYTYRPNFKTETFVC